MLRALPIILLIAASTRWMVDPAAAQDDKGPIKIGFIAPVTGVASLSGKSMVEGIQMYVDETGHRMGGRKVELIVEDDKGTPITALEAMDKLVNQDKVHVVAGIFFSNVAYALAKKMDEYKVPMILIAAGADNLTQRDRGPWIFRSLRASSQTQHPFGEWVYRNLGYKKIATLGADYAFGWEVVGGFQRSFEDAGGQIVQKIWAPVGVTDFASYISQIRKDADALFIVTVGTATTRIPQQLRGMGVRLPLLGDPASFNEALLPSIGKESLAAFSPQLYTATLDSPANRRFVKAYRAKFGSTPSFFVEGSYTTGLMIHKAVDAVQGHVEDKDRLLSALKKVKIADAPRGPVRFDDYSNAIQNIYICKVEKRDGQFQNTVVETIKDVSQFWKFNPEEFLKKPPYTRDYPPCSFCAAK